VSLAKMPIMQLFLLLCSKLCQKHVDIWELGDNRGRYKRNSLVKIIKEKKFGNLKTCQYKEMSIYRMSITLLDSSTRSKY